MFLLKLPPAVSVTEILFASGLLWAFYFCGRLIYNIYLHPLAKFPGSKLHAATSIPYYWATWLGKESMMTKEMHDRYGPVVRIMPDTLSFITAQSWRDIYYRPGKPELPKNSILLEKGETAPLSAIKDATEHARARGLLSPAFSERAMREQESLISGYVDLLIKTLKAQIQGPARGEVDLVQWYNFTLFDIIGDLALGKPFGSLESGETHSWISNIFQGTKLLSVLTIVNAYPILGAIMSCALWFQPKARLGLRVHREYTEVAMKERLARKDEKKDFISYIIHPRNEKGLTFKELNENAVLLILAGSETTATALSGATYYLLKNGTALEKVRNEVRSSFRDESSINFMSVARLPYLNAVIEETLRIYPALPSAQRRHTHPEGNVIDGYFVPGNTKVGISQWSAHRSKHNFRDPEHFIPERWLGDPAYAEDKRAAFRPFSYGPRDCIGKALAYAEIRSVLARMLWNFDMELCEASKDWSDQLVFILWEKPALMVKLTERKTS